jgi:hypothetical protein
VQSLATSCPNHTAGGRLRRHAKGALDVQTTDQPFHRLHLHERSRTRLAVPARGDGTRFRGRPGRLPHLPADAVELYRDMQPARPSAGDCGGDADHRVARCRRMARFPGSQGREIRQRSGAQRGVRRLFVAVSFARRLPRRDPELRRPRLGQGQYRGVSGAASARPPLRLSRPGLRTGSARGSSQGAACRRSMDWLRRQPRRARHPGRAPPTG